MQEFEDFTARSGGRSFWNDGGTSSSLVALPCGHCGVQRRARADVPDEIMDAIRLGWLTALRKPNGSVRGIVVGDIVRKLVGRTMAQQFSKRVEVATSPFQCALSTRAGTECVTHVLQTLRDLDERATMGACDLFLRHAIVRSP